MDLNSVSIIWKKNMSREVINLFVTKWNDGIMGLFFKLEKRMNLGKL
jgi:hypothetical protein